VPDSIAAGEDPAVEQRVAAAADKRGVVDIKSDQIGRRADGDPRLDAERLRAAGKRAGEEPRADRRRSEEHTSELQSLMRISYAVFCLKKKQTKTQKNDTK